MSIKLDFLAPAYYQQSAKIFIVDDTLNNVDILRFYLEQEGHKLAFANTGERALQLIPKWQPHLILLDIMMTPMDGFKVCCHLKENSHTAHIPIIFISALNSAEDIARGFRAGGVDYLTKPLSRQEVVIKVKTQLERVWYRQRMLGLQQDLLTCADYLLHPDKVLGILQLDVQGQLLACNQYAAQLLSLQQNELPVALSVWFSIFAEKEQTQFMQYWTERMYHKTQAIQLRSQMDRLFELQIFSLLLEQNAQSCFIVCLRDLSTEKNLTG